MLLNKLDNFFTPRLNLQLGGFVVCGDGVLCLIYLLSHTRRTLNWLTGKPNITIMAPFSFFNTVKSHVKSAFQPLALPSAVYHGTDPIAD